MIGIIFGLAVVLVIPGLFFSLAIFKKNSLLEKIIFTIAISISLNIFTAFILGGSSLFTNITGGITFLNIIVCSIIFALLGFIYYIK